MAIFRFVDQRNATVPLRWFATYLTRYIDGSELSADHYEKKTRFFHKPYGEIPETDKLRTRLHTIGPRIMKKYSLSSSSNDNAASGRLNTGHLDTVRLRHVASQLSCGRLECGADLGADFLALCQVLIIFSKDFEQAHNFVDKCLHNWYESLDFLITERAGPGYLLAGVMVSIAHIDRLTHWECTKKLGFPRVERLGAYLMEDVRRINAVMKNILRFNT